MFKSKRLLPFSLLFGLGCIVFMWLGEPNYVDHLSREDGPIEYLSALFFLIGLILAFMSIFKHKKRIVLSVIWAFLCLVFLGEETSWFQRILNYSVPAVEQINEQGEFTLHNLQIFDGQGLFEDGKISKKGIISFLKSSQNIFRLGFFGYFLILPLLSLNKIVKRLLGKVGYVKPSKNFILVLLAVLVLSFVLAVLSPEKVKMAIAETREMLYAFFIFLYIGIYIWSNDLPQIDKKK